MKLRRQSIRKSAFTMVEIALCLAVIGFALVAIIGVLPLGMQVQRDNRAETIINHDGTYFMEAIRQGKPIEDLKIFVENISLYTNNDPTKAFFDTATDYAPTNGYGVLGLLSNPTSSKNEAIVRSLSGPAQERGTNSGPGSELAFRYKLIAQIRPFTNSQSGIWITNLQSQLQSNYIHEVRLTMRYPLLPNNKVGNGRKVFRALISGNLRQEPDPYDELWFFHSDAFGQLPPGTGGAVP